MTLFVALCLLAVTASTAAGQQPAQPPPDAAAVAEPPKPPEPQQYPEARSSRISDASVQRLDIESFPKRPKPLIEIGPAFLGTGLIKPGFELPTGAVWQPRLIVFGTLSTALQTGREPFAASRTTEWANRLDLYSNLQLSGTERLLVGFRPLDDAEGGAGYDFSQGVADRWRNNTGVHLSALFFEGEIGEIFPRLDGHDRLPLDIGFSVGRQPFIYQDGILIADDAVDAVGITRNTLLPRGGTNMQLTGVYGWGALHGHNNLARPHTQMVGALTAADIGKSSFNGEFFYVDDRRGDNDGVYWAVSRTRRHGHLNTTFRAMGSYALHAPEAAPDPGLPMVDTGHLLFSEVSWTPPWSHDLVYINSFAAIGEFTSVARAPGTGGPLGRAGILFAATGVGRYPSPLSSRARDTAGAAIGYQKFLVESGRKQIVFELDGRASRDRADQSAVATGARYQQAFGRRTVLQFDAYAAYMRDAGAGSGSRVELRFEF